MGLILQQTSFNCELSLQSIVFITGTIPFSNIQIKIQMLTTLIELKDHPLKMDPQSLRNPI